MAGRAVWKSRESIEASIVFSGDGSDDDMLPRMATSDDNWEGYSTPTGSSLKILQSADHSDYEFDDEIPDECARRRISDNVSPPGKVDSHMSTEAPNEAMEMLIQENALLTARIEQLSRPESELEKEIESLKLQLAEANGYVDQVDIEAEQQYTELTSEIDELCTLVEAKDKEITQLKEQLAERKRENERLAEQAEAARASTDRHKEVIESIRDQADNDQARLRDVTKEKDRLLSDLIVMKQKMETEKGNILAKEVMLSLELEDVQRELNKQKEILASTSMAEVVNRCERRVMDMENQISERDVIIHTQQAIINKLRVHSPSRGEGSLQDSLRRRISNVLTTSGGSSSESFQSQNHMDESSRTALFNYILSDRNTQLANLYSIGRILELSSQEEKYLERYLSGRGSRYF